MVTILMTSKHLQELLALTCPKVDSSEYSLLWTARPAVHTQPRIATGGACHIANPPSGDKQHMLHGIVSPEARQHLIPTLNLAATA